MASFTASRRGLSRLGASRDPVVIESTGNPLLSFRFVFHLGSSADPPGKEGLASLTALMISEGGTEELSLTEVMEALYPMAAGFSSQPDKDVTTFIGGAHRDHLESYYSNFRDRLQRPRFDRQDFERNKKAILNYLTKTLPGADDEELGKESLEAALYAGHPYGHPVRGTIRGVEAIGLEDVKEFYRTHYTFENLQIGIAGELPPGFARRVQEDFHRTLPAAASKASALPIAVRGKGLKVTILDKPGAAATAISLGFSLDVTRGDDDFYPLLLANIHLGDHRSFHGVLMNELRAKRGLNYGNYSYVESFIQDGGSTFPVPNIPRRQQRFSIWIRPLARENAHFALRGAIYFLRRLVERGMSSEEMEAMREYVTGYSRLWVQSLDRRLGYQLDSSFYGTGFYLDEIDRRLRRMTVLEVNGAVKRHLDRWDFHVAIVAGNALELARSIETNAASAVVYQTPATAPEVLGEDRAIQTLALPIESVRIVPVQEIFER